jgi:hypothetical protein
MDGTLHVAHASAQAATRDIGERDARARGDREAEINAAGIVGRLLALQRRLARLRRFDPPLCDFHSASD